MKDLPIVYVARPLFRRGERSDDITVVGYVTSKAYLRSKTTTYCEGGATDIKYTVEYFGFLREAEMLAREYNFVLGRGVVSNVKTVFDGYTECKQHTSALNQNIKAHAIKGKKGRDAIIAENICDGVIKLISILEMRNIGFEDETMVEV